MVSMMAQGLKPGDEVIAPSYSFVSTVNAFVLRGAKIIFADSEVKTPNIDIEKVEELITQNTKVVVVVHYAGVACDLDPLFDLCCKNNIKIVEDAAQAIDSYYKGIPLGSIGNFSAFSFHETKNIISGEGGLLVVNDSENIPRAEIIREKGTNRSAFFRGEVDKYTWVDIGSSFLPSDIIAAFLYAQLENIDTIQEKRKRIWEKYYSELQAIETKGYAHLPFIPKYATNNAHMFYIICENHNIREKLITYLKKAGILAVFHYLSLHKSPFYIDNHDGRPLVHADKYSDCLIRLPIYYELSKNDQEYIISKILQFFGCKNQNHNSMDF